jgi:NTE family protein
MALCLSGGGYRAMLYHLGAVIRLNEAGVLGRLKRISSVSGGSITAAVLGLRWRDLKFENGRSPLLSALVVDPIRELAGRTIDVPSVLIGALLPFTTISDRVVKAYDESLFHGKTLADLPSDDEGPRFVINSTNVQTGSLWRFSRPYMGDWKVALWNNPTVPLAKAVAASSAFPPVLSPCILDITAKPSTAGSVAELFTPPYTTHVILSDGGVYDNLGLETAFKRHTMLLVSDGGMKMTFDPRPHEDWGLHAKRVLDLIDNQVRCLRKRQLIEAYMSPAGSPNARSGTYWGIASHLEDYGAGDPFSYFPTLPAPAGSAPKQPAWKDTQMLAAIPTRLAALELWKQEALINWGYVVCDTALRAHAAADLKGGYGIEVQPAHGLPYPSPK